MFCHLICQSQGQSSIIGGLQSQCVLKKKVIGAMCFMINEFICQFESVFFYRQVPEPKFSIINISYGQYLPHVS